MRQIFAGSHPSGPPANRRDQGEAEAAKETRDEANGSFEILEQRESLPRERAKGCRGKFSLDFRGVPSIFRFFKISGSSL